MIRARIKQLLKWLVPKQEPAIKSEIEKSPFCRHHPYPDKQKIYSVDRCLTTNRDLCYMCSNESLDNYHELIINSRLEYEIKNETIQKFNNGYLSKLDLDGLKCTCGNDIDIDQQESAICAACGTAHCSDACHYEYSQQTERCQFHTNFPEQDYQKVNFRSIRLNKINQMLDQQLTVGTIINQTSKYFVKAFLSDDKNSLYLQRGFKIQGIPSEETGSKLMVYDDFNIDYAINDFAVCRCTCNHCLDRGVHPRINCFCSCLRNSEVFGMEPEVQDVFKEQCRCNCEFCSSSIINQRHSRIDCLFYCSNSSYQGMYDPN